MDSDGMQTIATHAVDDRIPLPPDANVLPPEYRSAISREWMYRFPRYYSEWEEIYWLFDGWDALADELYADWADHVSNVDAIRQAFAKFKAGETTFPTLAAKQAYRRQLEERNERMYERARRLSERFAGPAGLCLIRRRYLARNPELDRNQRLRDLPSLRGSSIFSLAVEAGKSLAHKIFKPTTRTENVDQGKGAELDGSAMNIDKSQASTKAVDERETLINSLNNDKTKRDALSSAQDQLDTSQRKIDRLESEEAKLQEFKDNAEKSEARVEADHKNVKSD